MCDTVIKLTGAHTIHDIMMITQQEIARLFREHLDEQKKASKGSKPRTLADDTFDVPGRGKS